MANAKSPAPNRTRSRASDPPPSNKTSGTRRKQNLELPPLDAPRASAHDPELEQRLFTLVTAVKEDEGMAYTPGWLDVVHAAKVRGYVEERGLKLYLRKHGEQFLSGRADEGKMTMTKIDPVTRLQLKDLARETGVPMQEAISYIIGAIHDSRDDLTRAAMRGGEKYPWDAIRVLLRK